MNNATFSLLLNTTDGEYYMRLTSSNGTYYIIPLDIDTAKSISFVGGINIEKVKELPE